MSSEPVPSPSGPGRQQDRPEPGKKSEPPPDPESDVQPFRVIGSTSDSAGDATAGAPAHADVTRVSLEDDGKLARVSVEMAGQVPAALGEGEVEGIGIDIFKGPNDGEDDYQLFASGDSEGWLGYLYTPQGFADYQGAFEIVGDRLVFTVAWDSLGGRIGDGFSAFVDWSGPGPVGANPASQDLAPDSGAATVG